MALDRRLTNLAKNLTGARVSAQLKRCMEDGTITPVDVKGFLAHDPNMLDVPSVRFLLDNKYLTKEDFESCGIDGGFIDLLSEPDPIDPAHGDFRPINNVRQGVTEVYFWGLPTSGKSCALGAIMSVAKRSYGQMITHPCQGGDYMNRLSSVFSHNGSYAFLPMGTNILNTYDMRFSMVLDKKKYPLAFIDMSGELFACLYKKHTDVALSEDEEAAFGTLMKLLGPNASHNRKIHFFVVEYGAEKNKFNGLTQDTYLQRAAEYLCNMKVFDELTDAIYIILTKADKAGEFDSAEEEDAHFKNYMANNYHGFYWALAKMCEVCDINDGVLEYVPFSIGEVCFRRLCRFETRSAVEILDYILERATPKSGKLKELLGD